MSPFLKATVDRNVSQLTFNCPELHVSKRHYLQIQNFIANGCFKSTPPRAGDGFTDKRVHCYCREQVLNPSTYKYL